MIVRDLSRHPGKVRVTFTIPSSMWADTIHLVGDFNNWNQHSLPLIQTEGYWAITLELEDGERVEFTLQSSPKGPQATDVVKLDPAPQRAFPRSW